MSKEILENEIGPRLFILTMNIVVKDPDGNYQIFLKDLCKILSLDIKAINKYFKQHYSSLRHDSIPHLELTLIAPDMVDCRYISDNKKYTYCDDDIFCITPSSIEALPYLLLDISNHPAINNGLNPKLAMDIYNMVKNCLIHASEYEKMARED